MDTEPSYNGVSDDAVASMVLTGISSVMSICGAIVIFYSYWLIQTNNNGANETVGAFFRYFS